MCRVDRYCAFFVLVCALCVLCMHVCVLRVVCVQFVMCNVCVCVCSVRLQRWCPWEWEAMRVIVILS